MKYSRGGCSGRFTLLLVAAAVVPLATAVGPAWGQVGTGWTAYTPPTRVQTRGCASHNQSGGVETFALSCDATSGDNRAEQRIENDYGSGTRQFEGEVRVVSLGGSNVSLKQTFMPNNGAFLMIAVATGGRLYSVGDNGELAMGIIGRWVRINTVHDVAAGTHKMFIDGVLRVTKTGARQVQWHDKYGTYRLGSGRGPIMVEWRNVKYFRDGRADDMGTPSPPDGGGSPDTAAADGGVEAGAPVDGNPGTGGAPGTGGGSGSGGAGTGGGSGGAGTGGGSGTGGMGTGGGSGRGGAGGSRADAASGGPTDPESSGCGCAVGGRADGDGLAAVFALPALAAVWLMRSRRRRTRAR